MPFVILKVKNISIIEMLIEFLTQENTRYVDLDWSR